MGRPFLRPRVSFVRLKLDLSGMQIENRTVEFDVHPLSGALWKKSTEKRISINSSILSLRCRCLLRSSFFFSSPFFLSFFFFCYSSSLFPSIPFVHFFVLISSSRRSLHCRARRFRFNLASKALCTVSV